MAILQADQLTEEQIAGKNCKVILYTCVPWPLFVSSIILRWVVKVVVGKNFTPKTLYFISYFRIVS